MATEPAISSALIDRELAAAATASVREVINDLIDLLLGSELATRTQVPLLPARRALGAPARGQQLLRFRARLRPALLTGLGRILRRGLRTRPRVLPGLLL